MSLPIPDTVPRPASPYLAPGEVVGGRYEVGREIGRGGYSVVYEARDRELATDVALKLLVPPPAAARVARERLRREVQAVRGLAHEHVVAVHDLVEEGERSVLVMELVRGPDLERRVRERGPLPPDDAARLGRELAEALAAAHRRGILHRDVKPQNVLLEERPGGGVSARLTDFGSARLDGLATLTETGALVGTLPYVAPELLAGRRADARADVYALGMTLYWALAGRLPDRPSPHLPPPPAADGFRPAAAAAIAAVPRWLDDVVACATAADPARRFPTAAAMADAIRAGEAGAPVALPTVAAVAAAAASPHESLARVPLPAPFVAFCALVALTGTVTAMLVHPAILLVTIAFVGVLLLSGARRVRAVRAAAGAVGAGAALDGESSRALRRGLPRDVASLLGETIDRLPAGSAARALLADVARLAALAYASVASTRPGRRAWGGGASGGSGERVEDGGVGELVAAACDSALALARADETLALLERRRLPSSAADPAAADARWLDAAGECERTRDAIAQRMLEAVAALGAACAAAGRADATDATARLQELARELEREAGAKRDATAEVEALLAAPGAAPSAAPGA